MRTPYDKNFYRERTAESGMFPYFFAEQGYVVVIQDCRGRFESEGTYVVSAADSRDGDDAITWAALQPWSNGCVGTYGCSYSGENQIETAKLRNPHLKAMIPRAAGGAVGTAGSATATSAHLRAGFLSSARTSAGSSSMAARSFTGLRRKRPIPSSWNRRSCSIPPPSSRPLISGRSGKLFLLST